MGGMLIISTMIYVSIYATHRVPSGRHGSGGCSGVHRARARIHPHVKHTRSSSTAHRNYIGHNTHFTKATKTTSSSNTWYARKQFCKSHATRGKITLKTQPSSTSNTNELSERRGTASPGTPPPWPPFACRCRTYFLHSNFSSTIFMFEEYLGESEICALIDTYYLGIL